MEKLNITAEDAKMILKKNTMKRWRPVFNLVYNVTKYVQLNGMMDGSEDSAENFYRKMGHYIYLNIVSRDNVPWFKFFMHPSIKIDPDVPSVDFDELKHLKNDMEQNADKYAEWIDHLDISKIDIADKLNLKFSSYSSNYMINTFDMNDLYRIFGKIIGNFRCKFDREWITWGDRNPRPCIEDALSRMGVTCKSRELPELYALIFLALMPNKEIFMDSGIIEALKDPKFFYVGIKYDTNSEKVDKIVDLYYKLHENVSTIANELYSGNGEKWGYHDIEKETLEILLSQLKRWYPRKRNYTYLRQEHYY